MSSTNTTRLVVPAPANTPCGWWMYGETGHKHTCGSGRLAVHVLTETLPVAKAGTALCGFHSPYDVTEADRAATNGTEAGVSGLEILADMLTLDTPAEAPAFDVVKFHKLSPAMVGVLTEVAGVRGLVGAWAMSNVVIPAVKGATKRTVTALITRGILADEINEGNQSGTGGFHDYVLTERGREVASILGVLAAELPTVPEVIAAVVAAHGQDDCATGCEVLVSRGLVMLPAGGDVCYGCGSIFTRPNGQEHPSLTEISLAVVARNQAKGN